MTASDWERGDEDKFNATLDDIEFVDELPPAISWDSLHRHEVQRFAAALRRNPGRWAVYPWVPSPEAGRTLASRISRGRNAAFAKGFQAVSRRGTVYVRYEEVD